MFIPVDFQRFVGEVFEGGAEWVAGLPALLAETAERHNLTLLPPFPLSYNYVAPAVLAGGREAVLKAGVPAPELWREMDALQWYAGRGMARLIWMDREQGLILLERVRPGTPLVHLADDEKATAIAARLMRRLWRPLPAEHPFRPVTEWAAGLQRLRRHFDGGPGPFPAGLVAAAEQLFAELLASAAPPVLIHGDLHHENILQAGRESWLAIDPKGMAGEPAYEVGALMRNPLTLPNWPDLKKVLARRADQLAAELDLERERIVGYSMAQAVLSAWWSFEDTGRGWEPWLPVAEVLLSLL